jgi:hypothetical protein
MFDALESGKNESNLGICTNPLVSLPDSRRGKKRYKMPNLLSFKKYLIMPIPQNMRIYYYQQRAG